MECPSILDPHLSQKKAPRNGELLEELKAELQLKTAQREEAAAKFQPLQIDTTQLQNIQDQLKKLILLLNSENPSPEQLHQIVGNYVSGIVNQRETKTVFITYHIRIDEMVLYQKTVVADWDMYKH